jgi:hypothetical protein
MKFKRYMAIAVPVAVWLYGCSYDIPIYITNHSGQALRDVTVSGSGFQRHVALIPAGETATVYVDPKGESGAAVAFDMGQKRFSYAKDGYFESDDWEVVIIVDAAGRASVEGYLAGIFPQIFGRWHWGKTD